MLLARGANQGVGAWLVLQVAAIVLPGFGSPTWVLRALMIALALGFGAALLAGWTYDRRAAGHPLSPRAVAGRVGWLASALLPTAAVTVTPAQTTGAPATPTAPADPLGHAAAHGRRQPLSQDQIIRSLGLEKIGGWFLVGHLADERGAGRTSYGTWPL